MARTELQNRIRAIGHPHPGILVGITYQSVVALKLDPRNPRLHSKKQVRQIARSIETFGFVAPILVDKYGKVIAGHGRLLAAQLRRMSEVPTICLEHLTDTQIQAFLIADNRLAENATWDDRLLGEQLKALSEADLDFSLDVIGFETSEIDLYIQNLSGSIQSAEDPADALPETGPAVTRPADRWRLGRHFLSCADALHEASYQALMAEKKAAMVLVDPPYNVRLDGHTGGLGATHHREFAMACGEMSPAEFIAFLTQAFRWLAAYSVEGALHFICMDWAHVYELLTASRAIYSEYKNMCVWAKDNAGMGSLYRSQHELIFVFKNGKGTHRNNIQLGKYGRYRSNVWHYPGMNSFSRSTEEGNLLALHPTVKPVALCADAMLDVTARGDIVLDSFCGSGTTLIAAERVGRVCYAMEIDPRYCDAILRRYLAYTGEQPRHLQSGKTFDQVARQRAKKGDLHG
jgi:DNA modification methylase